MVSSLHGLVMRSKEGLVLPHEIESIAVELRDGPPDRDVYRMIYILGRSGAKKYEGLLASFLSYPDYPMASGLTISILCTQWRLATKYRDALLAALQGHAWDEDEDVRSPAISAAGYLLAEENDCAILAELLTLTKSEDDLLKDLTMRALAMAMGTTYEDALPPRNHGQAASWSENIIIRAHQRYATKCAG